MRFCGVVAAHRQVHMAMLDPGLSAIFYEPGTPEQVAAELRSLGEVVVAIDGPLGEGRVCDEGLAKRGIPQRGSDPLTKALVDLLPGHELLETSADGVFFALEGRRLPAKRHPLGIRRRIEQLERAHVVDDGGDLWDRRIEEVDAAAAALCAHRYSIGDACWVGDPEEGVVVLPGSSLPDEFTTRGVLPQVERLELPRPARAQAPGR